MASQLKLNFKPGAMPTKISAPNVWKQPDVHQWSSEMSRKLLEECPNLPDMTRRAAVDFDLACQQIREYYGPSVEPVLTKMGQRKNVVDRDLGGVMPAGLLALVWFGLVTKIDEPECYTHFLLTLEDMGPTCIQGDTHRLFSTYVALVRAMRDVADTI